MKKFYDLDFKLEQKRSILSEKLIVLKNSYNETNFDYKEKIQKILLAQIEVLMELINTTKLKISLMQQFENEYNS